MNSTFKVVFNKARGALMVVNEVTSSVQAKGTKTVVATAVAAMIAGVAGTAAAADVDLPTVTDSGTVASAAVKVTNPTNNADPSVAADSALIQVASDKVTLKDQTYKTGSAADMTLSFKEGVTTLKGGEIKAVSSDLGFLRGGCN